MPFRICKVVVLSAPNQMASQASIKKQIADLQRRLAKQSLNGANNNTAPQPSGSRSKRAKRRAAGASNRNSGAGPSRGVVAPALQNTNAAGRSSLPDGSVRVRRRELLLQVKLNTATSVDLTLDKLPWLGKLANNFDRVRWHSAVLHWRPGVGTSTGGQILIGPDWDSNEASIKAENISSLTPVYESPVWQGGTLVLPAKRLMTRTEYIIRATSGSGSIALPVCDRSPCAVCVYVSASKDEPAGHLWLQYDVTLSGTVA